MEGLKRQLRFQMLDGKKSFIAFWSILLLSNVLFYILNSSVNVNIGFSESISSSPGIDTVRISVAASNIIAINIFIIVYSMVMYYESFPAAIGFSSTRWDFYRGAVIHNAILAFAMALIQGTLMKLDGYFINLIGKNPIYKQLIFDVKEDNILYIIFMLTVIFMVVCSIFNLLGAALYRFTWKLWIVIGACFLVIGNFASIGGVVSRIRMFIFNFDIVPLYVLKQLAFTVVLYILAYLLIRRISIRK